MDGFDFGWALNALREGERVRRADEDWDGGFLQLQVPDEHSKMTQSYIYIEADGERCPWTPTHFELLAFDWQRVPV